MKVRKKCRVGTKEKEMAEDEGIEKGKGKKALMDEKNLDEDG